MQSSVTYTLTDNVENLQLVGGDIDGFGNELDNVVTGSQGNNFLDGGAGTDVVSGGGGNDILAGTGFDTLVGGEGDDSYGVVATTTTIVELAGEGSDAVFSSVDYVLGDNIEVLIMQLGATSGTGNELNNQIYGSTADNILNGGDGQDFLEGGGGNDVFVFAKGELDFDYISSSFDGNGAGLGDSLQFTGYGAGATITQVAGNATGSVYEVTDGVGPAEQLIILGTYVLDTEDVTFL